MSEQGEFTDVVDTEYIPGSDEYTAWLAAGRPKISWDEYTALSKGGARRAPIQDVLPGL